MNYLLKTNSTGRIGNSGRNKSPFSLGRIVGIVMVACIALWWIFFTPTFLSVASHSVASAVTSVSIGIGKFFGGITTYFESKHSLAKENETLRDKLFAQDVQMVNFELLKKQNNELKEALGRTDTSNQIVAAVIRGVATSPYDTFLIDGGKRAGIVPGDLVLVRGAIPVGYVSKVFDRSAEVTMYSSSGETLQGVVTFREKKSRGNPMGESGNDASTTTATESTFSDGDATATLGGNGRLRTLYVTITGNGGGNFIVRLTKDVDVPSGAQIAMPGIASRVVATVFGSEIDSAAGSRILYALSPVNMLHETLVYIEQHHDK